MFRAAKVSSLTELAAGNKEQERKAIARKLDGFPDSVPHLTPEKLTVIKTNLVSSNPEKIREALKELEELIGRNNIGGGNAEFEKMVNANHWLA